LTQDSFKQQFFGTLRYHFCTVIHIQDFKNNVAICRQVAENKIPIKQVASHTAEVEMADKGLITTVPKPKVQLQYIASMPMIMPFHEN